MKVGTKVKVKR